MGDAYLWGVVTPFIAALVTWLVLHGNDTDKHGPWTTKGA